LDPVDQEHVARIKQRFLLERPYFIFVGTLERKKNIVTLTKAFDLFIEKTKLDLDLVIAGKGDKHYPDIKFQALEIKHRNRLVFTDFVSNDDLAALYQGAYAFISASLHEGFGLPGVEAMQFGLPILASNTEVFNEVYDNAGIYFDPLDINDIAEKMALVARDPQFHRQLQQKSLDRGQLFDWDKPAEQTLAVYESILKHSKMQPEEELDSIIDD
jgi:glycosyltransferase involved in cell wall biosynthesis